MDIILKILSNTLSAIENIIDLIIFLFLQKLYFYRNDRIESIDKWISIFIKYFTY